MIRNPFRDAGRRKTFDAVVECYRTRHPDIWRPPGQARPGNAWANSFWRGYDGQYTPRWDAGSLTSQAYACFRAGQEVAKEEKKMAAPPKRKPVRFSEAEINTVLRALRIADEDGSIYGGDEPGDAGYEKQRAEIDAIEKKLRAA